MEMVKTDNAPQAIGPYSQAVKVGGMLFCSGQIALKPDGTMREGGVGEQVSQVMENIKNVLEAAGTDFGKVVKTTIFLADMSDYAEVNEIYASYFHAEHKPARSTVEVSRLPKDVLVEVEVIAAV